MLRDASSLFQYVPLDTRNNTNSYTVEAYSAYPDTYELIDNQTSGTFLFIMQLMHSRVVLIANANMNLYLDKNNDSQWYVCDAGLFAKILKFKNFNPSIINNNDFAILSVVRRNQDEANKESKSNATICITKDGYLCISFGVRVTLIEHLNIYDSVSFSYEDGYGLQKKKNLGIFLAKSIHFLIIINQNCIRR